MTRSTYRPPHATKKRSDDNRPNANARGYTKRWKKRRDAFIASHPLCEHCRQRGEIKGAECVDHIVPHRGNAGLFWDESNWQSLCNRCHSRKTARGE